MGKDHQITAAMLRQRAEEILREKSIPGNITVISEAEMQMKLHELELQKIELQLQNEELSRAILYEQDARINHQKLINSIFNGIVSLSASGEIVETNLALAHLLGVEQADLITRDFKSFISGNSIQSFNTFFTKVYQEKSEETCFVTLSIQGGLSVGAEITGIVPENTDQCRMVITDISGSLPEEKSRLSEERRKYALAGRMNGKWDWDVTTGHVFYSSQWKAMLGYTDSEPGDTFEEWRSRVHPADLEAELELIDRHLAGESDIYFSEHRIKFKDGSYNWVIAEGKVVERDEQGKALRVIGTHYDITQHKRTEYDLNERIKELSIHNRISELMSNTQLSTEVVIAKIVELIPSGWQFPEYTEACVQIHETIYKTPDYITTEQSITAAIKVNDKPIGQVDVCYTGHLTGDSDGIFLPEEKDLLLSIAERLGNFIWKNEKDFSLSESERKFRNLAENMSDVIYEIDNMGIIIFISPSIEKIIGFTAEEIIGNNFSQFVGINNALLKTRLQELSVKLELENEYKILSKAGESLWIRLSTKALFKDGRFSGAFGTLIDITEKKLVELELQKSESLYRSILQASPDTIFISDLEGHILFTSPMAFKMFGYEDAMFPLNMPLFDFVDPKDHEKAKIAISMMFQGIYTGATEYRGIKADGSTFEMEVNGEFIRDADNQPVSIVFVVRDISERKIAEEKLRKSEEQYRRLIDAINDVIFDVTIDGIIRFVSPSIEKLLNLKPENLLGQKFFSFVHPDDLDFLLDVFKNNRFDEFNSIEYRCLTETGKTIWVQGSAQYTYAEGRIAGRTGILHDITERKLAEEKLRKSEEQYRNLVESINDAIFEVNSEEIITYISPAIERIAGYTPAELIGINALSFVYPDDKHILIDALSLLGETSIPYIEYRYITKSGELCWVRSSATPIYCDGKIMGRTGSLTDINKRKLAETALSDSEEKFSKAFQTAPYAISITGVEDGKFFEINDSFTAHTGYSKQEVYADSSVGLKLWADIDNRNGVIADLSQGKDVLAKEFDFVKKSGKRVSCIFSASMILLNNKPYILSSITDISEIKQTQDQLRKLSLAVEQSPVLIEITDLNGNIEYINPAFETTTGYSREELIGQNPRILKSEATDPDVYVKMWETITVGKKWFGELINKKKNGESYWESISITPVRDETGKITNYLAIKQDITRRKESEQEIRDLNANLELKIVERTSQLALTNADLQTQIEERSRIQDELRKSEKNYRSVVENVNEVIFKTDAEGLWLFLNKSWEDITGFSVEESLGELFVNYVHPDDRQRNMELFEPLINREKDYCRHQVRYLTKEGGFRWIEVFARLSLNEKDEVNGTYGTLQDITERRRAEEFEDELLQLSLQLTGIPSEEIASAIELALKRIGSFLGSDRAYIFELNPAEKTMSNTFEWCNDGINPEIDNLQDIPVDALPRWIEQLHRNENIIIPIVADLPESWVAEREILEPQGIKSLIIIPIVIDIQLIGFVGLDSVLKHKEYDSSEINILQVWSNMLAGLINNQRKELIIEQTRRNYETFFNTIDDFLFVLDEQGKILHTNTTVNSRLGYAPEELMDKSVLMVHPVERREEAGRIVGDMLAGIADFCPVPLLTKGSTQIAVETRVKPGFWDGKPVIFGVSKDVSKIRLSEEKFSRAFHSNSALMAISGFEDGMYMDVNNTFLDTLGYRSDEIIGRTAEELDIFVNKGVRSSLIKKLKAQIPIKEVELEVQTKSGAVLLGLFSVDCIFIGNEACLLTVMVDITERKRSENETIRQAGLITSLLDSIPDIVFFKDVNGVYLGCNPPFTAFVGKTKKEIIGKTDYDLVDKETADAFRYDDLKTIEEQGIRHIEELITYPNGMQFLTDTLKTPYRGSDGSLVGVLGISRDITDSKRTEKELVNAKNEAEKANLAKSEFLSRMSHELRTPMNSILGFAQLMEMGELTPAHRKGVNHILKSGKHLLDLINEVLDISRIEAGRISLSMEPVRLRNVILEMLDIVQLQAVNRNQTIELLESPSDRRCVLADKQRLKQVLLNLIANALKYNHEGGSVQIKTEIRQPGLTAKPMIRISVIDTGIGIKPDELDKIFLPFERIGAERTETEGTGLGLNVVKKLMEAMHGNVGVDSIHGEGSIFWIELEETESLKLPDDSISSVRIAGTTEVIKNGSILYFEDNISNIELVDGIIETHRPHIRILTSVNGKYAVKLAKDYRPDLILLDLDLPEIHGSEVFANLQADTETRSIPVIIISADAMTHQINKMLKSGAKDYLTKPIEIAAFLKMVDKWIGTNKPEKS